MLLYHAFFLSVILQVFLIIKASSCEPGQQGYCTFQDSTQTILKIVVLTKESGDQVIKISVTRQKSMFFFPYEHSHGLVTGAK